MERGVHNPRDSHKGALAGALGVAVDALLSGEAPPTATLLDTLTDLPLLLERLLPRTACLRAFRLAAPYPTAANVQKSFRAAVGERLLAGTLEVQRVEIVYSLRRLQEALSNVFRYDGASYHLKAYCLGLTEVTPAMGGYLFDEADFVLGGYWTGVPPHNKPGLHCAGEPFRTFLMAYWDEIWPRGTPLNLGGRHDLSAIRDLALRLGLERTAWPEFVEQARALDIGDGAPPLI